jgi:predicted metal-dependent hydrolase
MLLKNRLDLKHEHLSALLEDFITKRKNAILMKHVPYNISPETLLAKLNLDLRSIRKVFDYRVKAIKSEKKLIKMANDLLEKEIL